MVKNKIKKKFYYNKNFIKKKIFSWILYLKINGWKKIKNKEIKKKNAIKNNSKFKKKKFILKQKQ